MSDKSRTHPPGARQSGENDRMVRSEELFKGATRLLIDHNNKLYVQQITKLGKLILTK